MSQLHSPSAERNRHHILPHLRAVLPAEGRVLEVASGSGQHAVFFARALPGLRWLPSDASAEARASIAAYRQQAGLPNLLAPLELDVRNAAHWPAGPSGKDGAGGFDALVCINMLHISPSACCPALLEGARRVLRPSGVLFLYGPYLVDGRPTTDSNAAFDASLRARNPSWGLRSLEKVSELAAERGFQRVLRAPTPVNNFSLAFRRAQPAG